MELHGHRRENMLAALNMICIFGLLMAAIAPADAKENLALDEYTCAEFLHDTAQPNDGSKVLKSMMMISWATGYASGRQEKFARADASAFVLMAGALGAACRKEPTQKAVQIIARLVQQASIGKAATASAATSGRSHWSVNGAIAYLVANGANREFYYERPTADLLKAGAQKGSLLFNGKKVAQTYVGTAYAFAHACKPMAYGVTGGVSADEKQVTLHGHAPVIDKDCHVKGHHEQTLVFSFIVPKQ
jgi:hypothetical protein